MSEASKPRDCTGRVHAALVVTAVLCALGSFLPGAWLWGGDLLRWQPHLGWALWILFTVCLVPPIAERVRSTLGASSATWLQRHFAALLAGSAALAVLLLPDRVNFVGDFLLRQGSSELVVEPGRLAPQTLPLDQLLHFELPIWLHQRFDIPPNATGRALGAASITLIALAAVSLAGRLVRSHSPWRFALPTLLTWGGWALLCTGYMKAFVEMTWMLPVAAVLALDATTSRRRFLWLSALVTVALLLHRSAIGLLPVWAYLAWSHFRKRGASSGAAVVGAAPVLLTAAWLALRVAGDFGRVDRGHFDAAAWFAPLHLLDAANGLWALAPLLFCMVPVLLEPTWWRQPSGRLLTLLALPYIGLAAVLTPQQGIYRDLDVLAASGMAATLMVAAALAAWDRKKRIAEWLAVPAALGAIACTLPKLVTQSQLDTGLSRIEAWVAGPPARSDHDRALTYEFLGARLLHARRYEEGAAYMGQAAALAPSPRMLLEWAVAAESIEDWDAVGSALTQIRERSNEPTYAELRLVATLGLAKVAGARGERQRLEELAAEAEQLSPGNRMVSQMLQDARTRLARAEAERAGREASSPDSGVSDP